MFLMMEDGSVNVYFERGGLIGFHSLFGKKSFFHLRFLMAVNVSRVGCFGKMNYYL